MNILPLYIIHFPLIILLLNEILLTFKQTNLNMELICYFKFLFYLAQFHKSLYNIFSDRNGKSR